MHNKTTCADVQSQKAHPTHAKNEYSPDASDGFDVPAAAEDEDCVAVADEESRGSEHSPASATATEPTTPHVMDSSTWHTMPGAL